MRPTMLRRIGWLLFLLLSLTTCNGKLIGAFAKPADLTEPPLCFWEEIVALRAGEAGPFPCVEAFIAGAIQTDCENDAMVQRETSLVEKCRE